MNVLYARIKNKVVLTTILALLLSIQAFSQKVVSIQGKFTTTQAMEIIEKQAGVVFVYNNDKISFTSEKISFTLNNVPLQYALNKLFNTINISWKIVGNNISLKKTSNSETSSDTLSNLTISGIIVDSTGTPLPGATIHLKSSKKVLVSNNNGRFELSEADPNTIFEVTYTGFRKKEVFANGQPFLSITLEPVIGELSAIDVVSTGYQEIPKERATGSFTQIDQKLLNRSVSPDIISHLSGVTNGLLTDENTGNTLGISVRGRSTIFANSTPLIILDNFPYEGDLTNINPNDIQSVTILKDASAASIWGVKAGNGVIVLTSKKGAKNQKMKLSIGSNLTFMAKPNLNQGPNVSTSEYIDLEKKMFDLGYFDDLINNPYHSALPQVIEILNQARMGSISTDEANEQVNTLRNINVRNEISKYFYQTALDQQYSINISGGSPYDKYYLSGGYDKDRNSLVTNGYARTTFSGANTYYSTNNKLTISTGVNFMKGESNGSSQTPVAIYPYTKLADSHGNGLNIDFLQKTYLDTVGQGLFLDWHYNPLNDLKNHSVKNSTVSTDYLYNLALNYKLLRWLAIDVKYQYGNGENEIKTIYNSESYFVRNLINSYSSINPSTKSVIRPVPLGAIFDRSTRNYVSQYARTQLNINYEGGQHQITAIVGAEIRNLNTKGFSNRLYGYDQTHSSFIPVDYVNVYRSYVTGSTSPIPSIENISNQNDRYVSLFGNAAYTFKNVYTISASARKDGSNLIGVNSNQKWAPLWSVGASWDASEKVRSIENILSFLKLRTTFGYNGNIDKSITAMLVTTTLNANYLGEVTSIVSNPPNPNLRWEKIGQFNLGVDFALFSNRISGSIDFYHKNGKDLIGYSPLAPSSGQTSYKGNTSNMKGRGLDIAINTENLNGQFSWNTSINLNYNTDKITVYNIKTTSNTDYVTGRVPIEGYPVLSLFSYKWAGLSSMSGDPQGYLNHSKSTDYSSILTANDLNSLVYNGRMVSPVFGNILNTFNFRSLSLSFNISYKFGSRFRRNSISYSDLLSGYSVPNNDIVKKWTKPGDEKTTNVPSLNYPFDPNRDQFYQYSSPLIENGGAIRLNDIQLRYNISTHHGPIICSYSLFLIGSNLGLLWRANKNGIDPDHIPMPGYSNIIPPKNFTVGLKMDF
ncbi:TonB-linked outer membrane protein, SusC/RagA family [Chitinophaga costaii]|uniref:TonB-linked outer membrane protein, SusC/RagA family n=1 Tax=Chitinophaga costaii TaxID=1335309 RepID=A0A1C4EVJ7_9BACT|nr:SusC/RagA family TonB-linked outer membrane protein [Chitinophaga costaii]SCC47550.1 TonB-linked outer membrane protein, SusC/RagA family [Chitinophaga costaii]